MIAHHRRWGGGHRAAAVVALLLIALGVSGVLGARAEAHAYVVSTNPKNGDELQQAPSQIRITFDENVTLSTQRGAGVVLNALGDRVDTGDVHLEDGGRTVVIGVGPLAIGTYIASWAVVSPDSHPVGGSLQFGYRVPAIAAPAPAQAQPSAGLQVVVGFAKGAMYLSLAAILGVLPALLVLGGAVARSPRLRTLTAGAAVVAIAVSLVQLVTQYYWEVSGIGGGATWSGFTAFLSSPYARWIFIRLGLLAALAILAVVARLVTRVRPWVLWPSVGILAVAAAITVVRNGHSSDKPAWYFASTSLHAVAALSWIGTIAALVWIMAAPRAARLAATKLPRLSWLLGAAVVVLLATGITQSLVQVGFWGAILTTSYGLELTVKVVLVVALLALAVVSALRVHRRSTLTATELTALNWRTRAEFGLLAAVITISGVLSSTEPAKQTWAPTTSVASAVGPYTAEITISPARRGPQQIKVVLTGSAPTTPSPESVTLNLTRSGSPAPVPVDFAYRLPGAISRAAATPFTYLGPSVTVPTTGWWTGTLTVTVTSVEAYSNTFRYQVR